MIYPNDNPLVGGHVADNRLLNANITTHYAWVNNEYVEVLDTTLNPNKRDNLLKQVDYSDYEVKHMTKGVIDCYNEDTLVYSFTFDTVESDYKAYGSTSSGKAIFMANPRALVIPPEAQNITITDMGQTNLTTNTGVLTSTVKFDGARWRTVVGSSVISPDYGYTYGKAFFMNGGLTAIVSNNDVYEQRGPYSWAQINTVFELPGTSVYSGRITKFVTKKVEYDILTNEEI